MPRPQAQTPACLRQWVLGSRKFPWVGELPCKVKQSKAGAKDLPPLLTRPLSLHCYAQTLLAMQEDMTGTADCEHCQHCRAQLPSVHVGLLCVWALREVTSVGTEAA
jgi:hypothetical protein